MAVIKPFEIGSTEKGSGLGTGFKIVKWATVTENDTCASYACGGWPNKSIHVTGTFGSSTTVVQGSNMPLTTADASAGLVGLRNSTHTAISITALALEEILENTARIVPVTTGGSSQSLDIYLLIQSSARR